MPHPRLTNEEIARLGKEIYATRLRSILEKEHYGEVVIIDVESGDYEIGQDSLAANQRALAKRPGVALYGVRVGFAVAVTLGKFIPSGCNTPELAPTPVLPSRTGQRVRQYSRSLLR